MSQHPDPATAFLTHLRDRLLSRAGEFNEVEARVNGAQLCLAIVRDIDQALQTGLETRRRPEALALHTEGSPVGDASRAAYAAMQRSRPAGRRVARIDDEGYDAFADARSVAARLAGENGRNG